MKRGARAAGIRRVEAPDYRKAFNACIELQQTLEVELRGVRSPWTTGIFLVPRPHPCLDPRR